MQAQSYIQTRLEELKSPLTIPAFQSDQEMADFIFKTLMSKKFRKFAVTPEYIPYIKESIANSIRTNEPIKFAFPFGAYKLWRLEEAPEADWAELFTLMYYVKWLRPIAEAYSHGIWFDFCSDDVIVERMNNIPKSDTEAYAKTFRDIIDFLTPYIPANMKFTLTPVSSFYTPEEFEADLADKIETMQKELGGLPVLDDRSKRMVEMNVRLKPDQDKDPLWREKVELLHQAYYTVSRRRPYSRAKDKILVFCTKMANCLSVGTTKTSVAKFWAGAGALKKTSEGFVESVLSPSQLEVGNFEKQNVSIKGLDLKNFKSIRIISF